MTAQEVIQQIKNSDCTVFCNHYKNDACPGCRWQVAIDALEKQIPQKSIANGFFKVSTKTREKMYCPSCNRRILNDNRQGFCPYCGQALDWED